MINILNEKYFKKEILIVFLIAIISISTISLVSAADITINPSTPGGLKTAIENVGNGQTIYMENGVYSGEDNTGFRISKSITISGKGNVVIDPQGKNNAFSIVGNAKVTLKNLKIENAKNGNNHTDIINTGAGAICNNNGGSLTVIDCTFDNNGVAIFSWKALTVKNSKFTNNKEVSINCVGDLSVTASTFTNNPDGGISCGGDKATISKCTFTNNGASNGVIWSKKGKRTISDCIFTNNKDSVIHSVDSLLSVSSCTFKNNQGSDGGAICRYGSSLSVSGCTFINNKAKYWGGAIFGASSGSITVKNSKFTNNEAVTSGGAIYIGKKCILNLKSATFKNNIQQGNIYNAISSDKGKVYKNKVTITPKDGTKNKKGVVKKDDADSFIINGKGRIGYQAFYKGDDLYTVSFSGDIPFRFHDCYKIVKNGKNMEIYAVDPTNSRMPVKLKTFKTNKDIYSFFITTGKKYMIDREKAYINKKIERIF